LGISGESAGGHKIEDEGVAVADQSVLNFVGGGVTADDFGDKTRVTIAGGGTTHDILSATHTDSIARVVARGGIIVGESTPLWDILLLGVAGRYLRSDGTDLLYSTIQEADLPSNIALNKLVALTINRALESDASGVIIASAVTNTELNLLAGKTALEELSNKNIASGYAGVDANIRLLLARLPIGTAFQRYRTNTGATAIENFTEKAGFEFVIGDGVSVIPTGVKFTMRVEFDCEITRWSLMAKESGSVVVDVNRYTSLANYDAGTKASITGSDTPDLVSDKSDDSTALTGWTVVLNEGDILECEVDSVTTITQTTLSLRASKRG